MEASEKASPKAGPWCLSKQHHESSDQKCDGPLLPGTSFGEDAFLNVVVGDEDVETFSAAGPPIICRMWGNGHDRDNGTVEATARLIAAAPGLLTSAIEAEEGIREAVRIMDLMGRGGDARELARHGINLRAAVAKTGAV